MNTVQPTEVVPFSEIDRAGFDPQMVVSMITAAICAEACAHRMRHVTRDQVEHGIGWVAVKENAVAGYIRTKPESMHDNLDEDTGIQWQEIGSLWVPAWAQGNGVAKALVAEATSHLRRVEVHQPFAIVRSGLSRASFTANCYAPAVAPDGRLSMTRPLPQPVTGQEDLVVSAV